MRRCLFMVVTVLATAFAGGALADKASKSTKPKDILVGAIHKIDVDAQIITVLPKSGKNAEADKPLQIKVDQDTAIRVDGAAAKFADLKEGMAVKITPSTGTAEKIEAKTRAAKESKPIKGKRSNKGGD